MQEYYIHDINFSDHKTPFMSFFLTFMGPCIVNVFKYNQQDAMLHSNIYYYICSKCFRWFLRPSSGTQNSTQHRVFVELFLRLTATVSELELICVCNAEKARQIPDAV